MKNHWNVMLTLSLALTSLTAGCGGGGTQYMRHVETPQALSAPPGQALVVFMRPSRAAPMVNFTIADDQGRFLGEPQARTHYAVAVDPGEHMFYAWSENVAVMEANLQAGRVYYIVVGIRPGAFRARVQLTALTPRSEHWPLRQQWLQNSRQMEADLTAGDAFFQSQQQEVMRRVEMGRAAWQQMDEADRVELTLLPEDGVS